jgi:hypothetical protein
MFRSLILLSLSTVAFAQTHQFRVGPIELVPGLRDRLALKQPAASQVAEGHTPVLTQQQPCSIPLLSMEIPKEMKFYLRKMHPSAKLSNGMPHARVAEPCQDR